MASSVINAPQYGIRRKSAVTTQVPDDQPSAATKHVSERPSRSLQGPIVGGTLSTQNADKSAARPRFEYPRDLVLPDTAARQKPADQPQRNVPVIVRKSRRIAS